MSSFTYILCACVVASLAFVTYLWHPGKQDDVKSELQLGVCILSAREHTEHRDAIRNTWLSINAQQAYGNYKTVVKFIIGTKACPIHPVDRTNPFGCSRWNVSHVQDSSQEFEAFGESGTGEKGIPISHLSILVLHPTLLKRIGIRASIPLSSQSLAVSAFKDLDEEELVRVKFSLASAGVVHGAFRYKPISPILLLKGIRLELFIDLTVDNGKQVISDSLRLNESNHLKSIIPDEMFETEFEQCPGVLILESLREDGTAFSLQDASFSSLISFMYSIHNLDGLADHIQGRKDREQQWRMKLEAEDLALQQEAKQHNDLLFVDVMDVYRSLPSKLLQCQAWFSEHYTVMHLLKTDDDVYLNLEGIISELNDRPLTGKSWWGNFRKDWMVERIGKWQEPDYPVSVYPPFACGSGYMISQMLHRWVVSSSAYFHHFQGEDVSLGIWLAPLVPYLVHDTRWQCFKLCQDNALSIPDLSPAELRSFWHQKILCGSPCSKC